MAVWTERYNVYTLSLIKEGIMNIVIDWNSVPEFGTEQGPGYRITFNGVLLKKNFLDLEEAKKAGLQFAMNILIRALQGCLY